MKNSALNINNLVSIGDLSFFEGPLISLFYDKKADEFYIFDWVNVDETYNKWLVYQTTVPMILDFFDHKISHRCLLENTPESVYHIVEVDNDLRFFPRQTVRLEDLPTKYLPTYESNFAVNDCPDFDKIQNFVSSLQSIAA